jgi:hypothetical protein
MHVTGFSFIKNGLKYDFPFLEAIKSILPVVDKMVIAVGKSEDETRHAIEQIGSHKIVILDTEWDESLKEGGVVLAHETNKALAAITWPTDWCFYIQGDEVFHEQYHQPLKDSMLKWKDDESVDGLLFDFVHFYGSYDYAGTSSAWYRNEIRVVRPGKNIYSYQDAQGFRKNNDEKLHVRKANAAMYHYGWVRPPKNMQKKLANSGRFWRGDKWAKEYEEKSKAEYDYDTSTVLKKFTGTHPAIMQPRIAASNWVFEYNSKHARLPLKEKFKNFIEWITGGKRPFDYKNYKL